jgi:hypothetical protein
MLGRRINTNIPPGEVPRRLQLEAQKLGPNDVCRQGIRAGNDQPRLHRMAPQRPRAEHGRVPDGRGQVDGESLSDSLAPASHGVRPLP